MNPIEHSQCVDPAVGELLVPYGLGTLTAKESTRFEDHLMECAYCRVELEAGFASFEKLHAVRPEMVRSMRNAGEDFESLLAGLGKPAAREEEPMLSRWGRAVRLAWNPWVYGPAIVATAAVILIVHMTGRTPGTQPSPIASPRELVMEQPRAMAESGHIASPKDAAVEHPEESMAKQSAPMSHSTTKLAERTTEPAPETINMLESVAPQQPDQASSPQRKAVTEQPPQTSAPSQVQMDVLSNEARMVRANAPADSAAMGNSVVAEADVRVRALALASIAPPGPAIVEQRTGGTDLHARGGRSNGLPMRNDTTSEKVEMLQGLAKMAGPEPAKVFAKAVAAYSSKDYRAAIGEFVQVVRTAPGDSIAWFYLGASQAQLGRWTDAIRSLATSDSLSGGRDLQARYYLALASTVNGNFDTARQLFSTISLRPDSLGRNSAQMESLLNLLTRPK